MNSDLIRLAYDFPVTTFVPFGPFDLDASGGTNDTVIVAQTSSGPVLGIEGFIVSSASNLSWVFWPSFSSGLKVTFQATNFVTGPKDLVKVSFSGFKLALHNASAAPITGVNGYVGYGQPDYAAWARELKNAASFFPELNDEIRFPFLPGPPQSPAGAPLLAPRRPGQFVNMPFLQNGGQW